MKLLRALAICSILAAVTLTSSSCSNNGPGSEKSHPLFIKATNARNENNYQDAASLYEEYLGVNPKSPKTHYELAAIYNDHLDDQLMAVYHYRKFLELDPNSPDVENVKKWIDVSKKKLLEKLAAESKTSTELENATKELDELRKQHEDYVAYANKLKEQNSALKQKILFMNPALAKKLAATPVKGAKGQPLDKSGLPAELTNNIPAPGETTKTQTPDSPDAIAGAEQTKEVKTADKVLDEALENSKEKTTAGKETASKEKAEKTEKTEKTDKADKSKDSGSYTTYKVKAGDTLAKISRSFYGTPNNYKAIMEANKDKINSESSLKIGMELKIPVKGQKGR